MSNRISKRIIINPSDLDPQLSLLQRLFLYAALQGRLNIFLTGMAGSGKSKVLSSLKQIAQHNNLRVAFTSTTGVSATNLPNGSTLHAYLGLGFAEGDPREIARKGADKKETRDRILSTDILVVDEISMCDARMLDVLDLLGQAIHKSPLPFGGKLQVIMVGDFAQIPPVPPKNPPSLSWMTRRVRT